MYCYFLAYLTTRETLLSTIHILAKRPELPKSFNGEVIGVIVRDRDPRLSDRKKYHLSEAVVMETPCYISHVPVHAKLQSTTIGGYRVAKDRVVGCCRNVK